MPRFGNKSKERLLTCHEDLQVIFNEVIKTIDCSILEGHRNQERQDKLHKEGKTLVKFPFGRHNANPSMACDCTPYPVNWADRERQTLFAGFVMGVAKRLLDEGKISREVRWGGDWNTDWQVQDNKFDDFPHFEIKR